MDGLNWLAAEGDRPESPLKQQKPNVPGGEKGELGTAFEALLGWLMWGSLAMCTIAFIIGVGMAAIGANSARPDMAERGKRAAMWALIGAAMVGLSFFLIDTFYNIG